VRVSKQPGWSIPAEHGDADDALETMAAVLWDRLALAVAIIALGAAIALLGCGGNDLVIAGALPSPSTTVTGTPGTPGCLPAGDACSLSSDCCSGLCFSPDGVSLICQ
jgi:hypothetical protein